MIYELSLSGQPFSTWKIEPFSAILAIFRKIWPWEDFDFHMNRKVPPNLVQNTKDLPWVFFSILISIQAQRAAELVLHVIKAHHLFSGIFPTQNV